MFCEWHVRFSLVWLMTSYLLFVTFDSKFLDKLNVGHVEHLESLHLEIEKLSNACPRATMKDVLPPPRFLMTPAWPCRDRSTLLGGASPRASNLFCGLHRTSWQFFVHNYGNTVTFFRRLLKKRKIWDTFGVTSATSEEGGKPHLTSPKASTYSIRNHNCQIKINKGKR